ncbi:MAG: VOC family protein [Nibricoccus sp.]
MKKSAHQGQIDYVEFPAPSKVALNETKKFYSEAFGWHFQDWGDDYADTKSSGVGSGINADSTHRTSLPLVVIFSSDLEATRDKIIRAGGKISKEIFSFPGGRRFHYRDPSGNELGVWSDK